MNLSRFPDMTSLQLPSSLILVLYLHYIKSVYILMSYWYLKTKNLIYCSGFFSHLHCLKPSWTSKESTLRSALKRSSRFEIAAFSCVSLNIVKYESRLPPFPFPPQMSLLKSDDNQIEFNQDHQPPPPHIP